MSQNPVQPHYGVTPGQAPQMTPQQYAMYQQQLRQNMVYSTATPKAQYVNPQMMQPGATVHMQQGILPQTSANFIQSTNPAMKAKRPADAPKRQYKTKKKEAAAAANVGTPTSYHATSTAVSNAQNTVQLPSHAPPSLAPVSSSIPSAQGAAGMVASVAGQASGAELDLSAFDDDDLEEDRDRAIIPKDVADKIVAQAIPATKTEDIVPVCIKSCTNVFLSELIRAAQDLRAVRGDAGGLTPALIYEVLRQKTQTGDTFPFDNHAFSSIRYE